MSTESTEEPNWTTPVGTIIDGYDATPPQINVKCIVFTMLISMGYWYLPKRNKWVMLALLYFPYIIMAWYDSIYNCTRNRLGPTFLGSFYYWAKPSKSNKEWHPKWKNMIFYTDMLILALAIYYIPRFLNHI